MLGKRTPERIKRYPFSVYEILKNIGLPSTLDLTYTNDNGETATFCEGADVKNEMRRYSDRIYINNNSLEMYDPDFYISAVSEEFKSEYTRWWKRRGPQWGRLMDAFKKTYDPISNYDRHEQGGWKDTNEIGARTSGESVTDTYGEKKRTTTDTPGVTETTTETPGVTTTTTVTPNTTETVTETPGVSDTVTLTPNTTETVTETPRVVMQTVTAPGSTATTASTIYGDNSSTAVPTGSTTVTNSGSDTVTVTPTTGTNETETEKTGTETTVTTHTGDNETVTEMTGTETTVEGHTGTNRTVIGRSGFNTVEVSDDENEDTHVKTNTAQAARDVLTRLYQDYHVYGNIGVTTSAQMLKGELELRSTADIIAHAILEFINLTTVYM